MCGAEQKLPGVNDGKRVTLTVAHLDHNEANNTESNLMVMCGACHLNYDRKDNWRRRKSRAKKRTNGGSEIIFPELKKEEPTQ